MLVILASHNGPSRYLKVMLDGMRLLRAPSGGLEIVAVDSASTDATRALLQASTDFPLSMRARFHHADHG